MDAVFRALADPTRRALLDDLFARDGQTLGELEGRREMTRFGVMKHLRVLEEAGLVTTLRRGRQKLHFLNAVPIQQVHDRWVGKYAAVWASALTDLKRRLEERSVSEYRVVDGAAAMTVFEIYIKTTPERLWEAITDPAMRAVYNFGVRVESDWTTGSEYRSGVPGVVEIAAGENLEVDPPRRLVQTMTALWSDEVRAVGATRVTWEIEPVGSSCRLRVTHDRLPDDADAEVFGGWPMILSGLKTLLETGEPLDTPGSLMYANPGG